MIEQPSKLTDSQKVCLRLVACGLTSKEIAQETGLAPQTVDTYLKSAMARLGASNRRKAARMLTGAEASQSLGSPSHAIAPGSISDDQGDVAEVSGLGSWLRLPPLGGRSNDLTVVERSFAILKVAAVGAVSISAFALIIAGLLLTFR